MSSPKPIRVLIVDDHPDTLEWMNLLLETRGYLVQTATDGAASEQLRERDARQTSTRVPERHLDASEDAPSTEHVIPRRAAHGGDAASLGLVEIEDIEAETRLLRDNARMFHEPMARAEAERILEV